MLRRQAGAAAGRAPRARAAAVSAASMSVRDLKRRIAELGGTTDGCLEKSDLVSRWEAAAADAAVRERSRGHTERAQRMSGGFTYTPEGPRTHGPLGGMQPPGKTYETYEQKWVPGYGDGTAAPLPGTRAAAQQRAGMREGERAQTRPGGAYVRMTPGRRQEKPDDDGICIRVQDPETLQTLLETQSSFVTYVCWHIGDRRESAEALGAFREAATQYPKSEFRFVTVDLHDVDPRVPERYGVLVCPNIQVYANQRRVDQLQATLRSFNSRNVHDWIRRWSGYGMHPGAKSAGRMGTQAPDSRTNTAQHRRQPENEGMRQAPLSGFSQYMTEEHRTLNEQRKYEKSREELAGQWGRGDVGHRGI